MSDNNALLGRRVLVVEDNYFQAMEASDWLQSAGAEVIGPTASLEDVESLLAAGVDTAIVDINLGNGPCFALPRLLTERRVPFVFVTGYDENVIPPEFQAIRRLEKPYRARDLIAAVCGLA